MKDYSDNPVENALLNDADIPLAPFVDGDPGKNIQTLVPTPEWKAFTKAAHSKGVSLSLMMRIAMRQHLEWLKAYRSPSEIQLGKILPKDSAALDHSILIQNTSLSTRLKNALRDEGFITIGGLQNLSRFRFMKIPHLGKKSLDELEYYLGRPLTNAVFEEIPGETHNDRRLRRMAWFDVN